MNTDGTQPAMIKVITFDLDDTLWDTSPVIAKAETMTYQWIEQYASKVSHLFSSVQLTQHRYAFAQQRDDLRHQISQLRLQSMHEVMVQCGYSSTQAHTLSQQAFDVFLNARNDIIPFPEAELLLKHLQKNYVLGALSNGNANIFNLDIGQYFSFSFSAEDLDASKPSADHFIAAQQHCQVKPEHIIHIGDNYHHDIVGAQQAGCHSIWLATNTDTIAGGIHPQTAGLTMNETVTRLQQIPDAVQRIEKQLSTNTNVL